MERNIIKRAIRSRYIWPAVTGVLTILQTKFFIKHRRLAIDLLWLYTKGHTIDWNHPRDLNEKVTWMMGKADLTQWARLTDKIEVKKWMEEFGMGQYVAKLYGKWKDPDEIDIDSLPEKVVFKCNHDCASTVIVDKSKPYDWEAIKQSLRKRIGLHCGLDTCEYHPMLIDRYILAEEYIENDSSDISSSIVDYKFLCFGGKPYACFLGTNRKISDGHTEADFDLYSLDPWQPIEGAMVKPGNSNLIPRPATLDQMIEVATKLSQGHPQVRVDLYSVGEKVYFGEMTFTSARGRMDFFTPAILKTMGDLVELPK